MEESKENKYREEIEWLAEFNIFEGGICNRKIVLFEKPGVPVANYNIILRNFYIHFTHKTLLLGENATLKFSNHKIPFYKIIAFGGANMIVEYNNTVYRINQVVELFEEKELYVETMDILNKIIPTVKIIEVNRNLEYIIAEKLNIRFTLAQYFKMRKTIIENERKYIDNMLVDFASLSYHLVYVNDLHENNIVYTEDKGWLVIDIISHDATKNDKIIEFYDKSTNLPENIFSYFKDIIPTELYITINKIILQNRY